MSRTHLPSEALLARLSPAARSLWAKSGDDFARSEGDEPWLALPQHMLDSAEVAGMLWDRWAPLSVRDRIVHATGLDDSRARVLLTWLAATHDAGKAILTFQSQLEQREGFSHFLDRLRLAGLPVRMSTTELSIPRLPHSLASRILVRKWLTDHRVRPRVADRLAGVLDAHHGTPSPPSLREQALAVLENYGGPWAGVHQELLDFAAALTGIREVLPSLRSPLDASGQSLLTGLVVMADWIASNAEAFPLSTSGISGSRVADGLDRIDLTSPWVPRPPDPGRPDLLDEYLRARFGWPVDFRARPIQRAVADACRALAGPGLVIIEAPTGEGKTEAALAAAEILAQKSGAGGVMVAAPTMATADGLFRRVLAWSHQVSGTGVTSMFLGHSKSMLNTEYRHLRFQEVGRDDPSGNEGSVIASQWMSGRKKGVLSTFSVATVDQVLFMALQSKHSMLRHLGLAGKVVVIDEVHAYDAYMSEYLGTALEWLSRYRVPVVLLSATLPPAQKRSLVEAYRSQLSSAELGELSTSYPLVTSVGAEGLRETVVPSGSADLEASLEIIPDSVGTLSDRLSAATADGGCVLVICNTVRRAQEAFLHLLASFPGEIELHHAAFLASERARKEEALRKALGPDAHRGAGRPRRRIIVATQVAEQSLDIDVDLLISDIAPIDLLIQRIGRLHRHERPETDRPTGLRRPQVLIRAVESQDPPGFESGAEAVYDRRLLLATLAVLQDGPLANGFTRPTDIAPLVHRTYGERPPIPSAWSEEWEAACADSTLKRETSRRRASTYRLPSPTAAPDLDSLFAVQRPDVDSARGEAAGLAQVRDSDPSIEVIPIRRTEHGYRPLVGGMTEDDLSPDAAPSRGIAFDLAGATVRLPGRMTRFEKQFTRVLDELEPVTPLGWQLSEVLKGQLALPLDEGGRIELAGRTLVYDQELGLHDATESAHSASQDRPVGYVTKTASTKESNA